MRRLKTSFKNATKYAMEHNGILLTPETEYSYNKKANWQCQYGHIFQSIYNAFQGKWCKVCNPPPTRKENRTKTCEEQIAKIKKSIRDWSANPANLEKLHEAMSYGLFPDLIVKKFPQYLNKLSKKHSWYFARKAGKLKVLKILSHQINNKTILVKCDCGNEFEMKLKDICWYTIGKQISQCDQCSQIAIKE